MKNCTIEIKLDEFLKNNKIELKEALECFKEEVCLYDIINKATDIEEFGEDAMQHIIDFITDQYDFKAFVDNLNGEQIEELKELL